MICQYRLIFEPNSYSNFLWSLLIILNLDNDRCLAFKYWLDIFEWLDAPENTVDVLHSVRVFGSNRTTVVAMPIDLALYFHAPGKWPAMDEGN